MAKAKEPQYVDGHDQLPFRAGYALGELHTRLRELRQAVDVHTFRHWRNWWSKQRWLFNQGKFFGRNVHHYEVRPAAERPEPPEARAA